MEELKEIATIIETLGEQGTSAFIWWLVLSKGTSLLINLAWLSTIVIVTGRIARGVVGSMKAAAKEVE